jgi:phage baseplate assembly protein gpV
VIEYDRAAHQLLADVQGSAQILASQDITILAGQNCHIKGAAHTYIQAESTEVNIEAPAVKINGYEGGATSGLLTGDFTIQGSLTVQGNIHSSGNISADGTIIDVAGNTKHHVHD